MTGGKESREVNVPTAQSYFKSFIEGPLLDGPQNQSGL